MTSILNNALIETFQFELTVEQRNLRDVVKVVLNLICFHRVFGTVRPRTIDLFGMTFPAIQEAEIQAMVEDKTADFCNQIQFDNKNSKRAQLHLYLLHPSTAVQKQAVSSPSTLTAGGYPHSVPSTSSASKSLKSWASTKTMTGYPYAWLAHAFSGGASQMGGSHSSTNEVATDAESERSSAMAKELEAREREMLRVEKEAFEVWKLHFDIVQSKSERDRLRLHSTTATQMAVFLDSLLEFVDEKKTHIPAIISADLCPFPIEIHSLPLP